jgi:hypothetical protein
MGGPNIETGPPCIARHKKPASGPEAGFFAILDAAGPDTELRSRLGGDKPRPYRRTVR